jgi:hypothetical protein
MLKSSFRKAASFAAARLGTHRSCRAFSPVSPTEEIQCGTASKTAALPKP